MEIQQRTCHAGARPRRVAIALLAPALLLALATGCTGEFEEGGEPPEVAYRLLDVLEQPTFDELSDPPVGEDCGIVKPNALADGMRVLVWARDTGGLAKFSFGFFGGTGTFTVESVAPSGATATVGPEAGWPGWTRITFEVPDPPGLDVQQSALAYIRLTVDNPPVVDAKATDLAGNSSRAFPLGLYYPAVGPGGTVCIGGFAG